MTSDLSSATSSTTNGNRDGDFAGSSAVQFSINDHCIIKIHAPKPFATQELGYLQYSAGDHVLVTYVGAEGDPENANWLYGKNLTNESEGWIEKDRMSILFVDPGQGSFYRGCEVKLTGLQLNPKGQDLNGRVGVCKEWNASGQNAQTWRVQTKKGEVYVRTDNLRHMNHTYSEGLSRQLAKVLRHRAPELGLTIKEEAYIPTREVKEQLKCSDVDLQSVISESRHEDGSPRFEMCYIDCEPHVRALKVSFQVPESAALAGPSERPPSVPQQQARLHHKHQVTNVRPSGNAGYNAKNSQRDSELPLAGISLVEALKELRKLKDEGTLDEEEFRKAKSRILE